MLKLFLFLIISTPVLLSCSKDILHLGVTTTLEDSGLLKVLTKEFSRAHHIKIKPIVAGSGQLFSLIERGDVDIAISHEPEGEKKLLARNIITARELIFYNYFLLVGHKNDPANITLATSTHDAFTRLSASHKSTFISRDDQSGTHQIEQLLWDSLQQRKHNIQFIRTGTGMGATLAVAAHHQAYTLVDLGTWLNFKNKQELVILWDNPQTLRNPYQLLTINSNVIKNTQTKNAKLFKQWITSPQGQQLIKNYQLQTHAVFFTEN